MLAIAGLAGLASAFAWLVAPTSASGPDGMPRGFESGLRYLVPALALGLALLPAVPALRDRLARVRSPFIEPGAINGDRTSPGVRPIARLARWRGGLALGLALAFACAALGYPLQRHYLRDRYADPSFTAPGLNAAFAWARDVGDARIATTSTRQYPLFGTDLSNRVQFVGEETPHGGFEPAKTCPQWRRLLNDGDYDYVIASRDRIEKGKPHLPTRKRVGPKVPGRKSS